MVLHEQSNIPIANTTKYYLLIATRSIPDFMAGNLLPFEDAVEVKKDNIYTSLISSRSRHDGLTKSSLMCYFLLSTNYVVVCFLTTDNILRQDQLFMLWHKVLQSMVHLESKSLGTGTAC